MDPDQTAPIGAVSSGPTLFASYFNYSVMLDNYLQQTTSADSLFRCRASDFFQDWWAQVTNGAKNGGSFSEMMGPSISN